MKKLYFLATTLYVLCSCVINAKAQVVTTLATLPVSNSYGVATGKDDTVYAYGPASQIIYKIDPLGTVTDFIGGTSGDADGTGTAAEMSTVYQLASDAAGNIYYATFGFGSVKKVSPAGVVTTIATVSGANFTGVAVGRNDTIYAYDYNGGATYKIDPTGGTSVFATGLANGMGLAFRSPDTLYLGGFNTPIVYQISGGTYNVLAGSLTSGSTDGTGSAAEFRSPSGPIVDGSGDIYVADYIDNKIRKITVAGVVTTFAGDGTPSTTDGTGASAQFSNPLSLGISRITGSLSVAQVTDGNVRLITGAVPLPLSWLSYSASLTTTANARIQWKVKEQNVRKYDVMKSLNAKEFETVGTVNGKGDGENEYSFTEKYPTIGTAYYRIRQTDADGKFTYSGTMKLDAGINTVGQLKVYPTVFNREFTIQCEDTQTVSLVDSKGQLIKTLNLVPGANTFSAAELTNGTYIIKTGNAAQMIVKQ